MAERRQVAIDSLDRVMPDVDRLVQGHETVGKWSLGQVCNHLSATFVMSMEGFGVAVPWPIRVTLGQVIWRKVLRERKMRAGLKVPERFLPRPGLDDRAEVEALRAAIQAYDRYTGPMAPHPMFGAIGRDGWNRLHCIHCAHHLSFVLPRAANAEPVPAS